MRTGHVIAALAAALSMLLLTSATVLAQDVLTQERTVSGDEVLVEYLDHVNLGPDGATIVLDVDGERHEVTVGFGEVVEGIQGRLADDELDVIDLATLPVAGGLVLKFMGFLLRLGRF